MQIIVNGKPHEAQVDCSIEEFLKQCGLQPIRVAVEVNQRLVSRKAFARTTLCAGDSIEIVTLVGGG